MNERAGILALVIIAVFFGIALNPAACWLWAKVSDWWYLKRPAKWGMRDICPGCGNAPESRVVEFRDHRPKARRAE